MDRTLILLGLLAGAAAFVLLGARSRRRRGRAGAKVVHPPVVVETVDAVAGEVPSVPEAAGAPMAVGAPVRRPAPGFKNNGASRFRPGGSNVRAIGKTALRR